MTSPIIHTAQTRITFPNLKLITFRGKIKEIKFPKDRILVSISYDSPVTFIVVNHLSEVFWEFKCDTKQKRSYYLLMKYHNL